MKTISAIFFVTLILPNLCLAENHSIPTLISDAAPTGGVQTLELKELWRAGGEDEDVIFGRITDIKNGPDGNTYVLDNQLHQVMVFSPEGEHLRDLSREGDGPGELRQPVEIAFLTDDILGIGMGFPGKVISIKLDGTPAETYYPIGEPSDGNIGLLMGFQYLNGVMVACGGRMVFDNPAEAHTSRFLSVCSGQCTETRHLLEKETPLDMSGQRYVEASNYYLERTWVLGPLGNIYASHKRDSYEISVIDKTGDLVRVFGRKYKARKRTEADKKRVSPVINMGNNPDMEIVAEDHDPCISRVLFNHDEATVWVLTPHGENDQPEGILEVWDVFSTAGEYLKQVVIPLGDEMNDGTIHLVGGSRLIVVKGTGSAFGGDDNSEEETEVEPMEVICYEIR